MLKIKKVRKQKKQRNVPNKATLKAIRDSNTGKNVIKAKDTEDLFRKLGI